MRTQTSVFSDSDMCMSPCVAQCSGYSAVDHPLHGLGVAVTVQLEGGCRPINLLELGGAERHVCAADVLLKAFHSSRARDGNRRRVAGEDPSQRDLAGR